MVCLRNISVDTLHKGDTEDDDDNDDDNDDNNNNLRFHKCHRTHDSFIPFLSEEFSQNPLHTLSIYVVVFFHPSKKPSSVFISHISRRTTVLYLK
jgi:hypothetical protein